LAKSSASGPKSVLIEAMIAGAVGYGCRMNKLSEADLGLKLLAVGQRRPRHTRRHLEEVCPAIWQECAPQRFRAPQNRLGHDGRRVIQRAVIQRAVMAEAKGPGVGKSRGPAGWASVCNSHRPQFGRGGT
jgi:hypothetical protein